MRLYIFFIALLLAGLSSCKKDTLLTTGGNVSFSKDTLTFDTVFTAKGSATREVRLFNDQNNPIRLSSVRLERGASSPFRLNVDGRAGHEAKDIDIASGDSIFIFASVTIDPTNADNPFVVEDRLIATLNGKNFSIPILAYGQNAVYIYDSVLTTQTWTANKPYVIINNALIDSGHTLTINAGVRVYNHAGSRLFVNGTLKALGTKTDSIIFQGDRIDRRYFDYDDIPGEWGGIYFTGISKNNELRHVIIKNGGNSSTLGQSFIQPASIQVDRKQQASSNYQLVLDKVTIQNSLGYGILSFGGELLMRNSLVTYCGAQAFAALQGGNYVFENCTFGGYGNLYLKHTDNPTFALLNYLELANGTTASDLYATITNCIIYGTLENELITSRKGNGVYNVVFENCLLKAKQSDIQQGTIMNSVWYNQDPLFEDEEKLNFRLKENSPALNKAKTLSAFTDDLDNKPRTIPWDLGCYERQ